jgi:hypothetical protein
VGSPGKRSSEASKDVVPLDPRSTGDGTGFLLKKACFVARDGAGGQENKRQHSQKSRRHLGHDGSKDLGRWVFALPVGVLSHVQGEAGLLGSESCPRSRVNHACWDKGGSGGNQNRKDDETQLGHFENTVVVKERDAMLDQGPGISTITDSHFISVVFGKTNHHGFQRPAVRLLTFVSLEGNVDFLVVLGVDEGLQSDGFSSRTGSWIDLRPLVNTHSITTS